jgi:hypothetical protein
MEHGELGNVPQVFEPDGARRYIRETAVGGTIFSQDDDVAGVSVTYESILESGWMDWNRRIDEKDIRMYVLDFHSDPANVYLRESSDVETSTSTSFLPLKLPFSFAPLVFPTWTEDRVALSDAQEYEVKQEPRHRLLAEPPFLVQVKLFTKDSMGGVSRIEVEENLTRRDELAIPVWFRSVFVKDRISMQGADSGKVYSRTFEGSLVATGGRPLSIRR